MSIRLTGLVARAMQLVAQVMSTFSFRSCSAKLYLDVIVVVRRFSFRGESTEDDVSFSFLRALSFRGRSFLMYKGVMPAFALTACESRRALRKKVTALQTSITILIVIEELNSVSYRLPLKVTTLR